MQYSPEQPRRPQKQRPELNLDTSPAVSRTREVASDSVPPRKSALSTNKGKPPPVSSRGFRLPASGSASAPKRDSVDSYLENESPIDAERAELDYRQGRPPRDSHDLSLPSQKFTRDSLLGNMLNSLDQFSLTQINTPIGTAFEDDGDPYGVPRGDAYTRYMTRTARAPANLHTSGSAHGHGYSYSSDFEGFDDTASRTSQHSRGRRSNSGPEIHNGLPRINSMRERSHPGTPGRRALHSRGGKTSKSSSLNSFDMGGGGYAQGLPSQRWGHAAGGRSSSFDYSQRPSLSAPGPWQTEFSNNFLVDDYETAPNPTIPGGPRRPPAPASPAIIPSAPASEYEPKTPDRKKEARSRSGTNKTTQSSKYTTARETAPPLPPLDVDSAPAPHVGYGKAKETQPAAPASAPPIKEKQGFFSRLFGTSRSTPSPTPAAVEPFVAPAPPIAAEPPPSVPNKIDRVVSHSKPLSAPPTRDSEVPRQTPHVVQKKSSFFRRRKKSITEPPVPPLPAPNPIDISKPTDSLEPGTTDPSPVSSLRQVMNPYLKGSNPVTPQDGLTPRRDGTNHTFENDARAEYNGQVRGFSPEYDPSPNATIRTVKSTSALKNQESRWRSQFDSPIRSPHGLPGDLAENTESTTFFHDSSDEGEKGQTGGRKQRQRAQTGKASSSRPDHMPRTTRTSAGERDLAESDLSQRKPSPNLPLQKSAVDEDRVSDSLEVPLGIPRKSSSRPTLSRSASSVPSVTVDSSQASPRIPDGPLDEPEVSIGEPTEDDRQKAHGIYDGDEDFIQKEKAAAWMGEEGPIRQRTLRAYMDLYNFENHSVLAALRQVCTRLVLRAETQQVDRILVAFSKRWCDCNPNHGFKSLDVIHTMCYSIMLLNTDLHLADIEQKMTRSQFIKNTMSTITQALLDSDPEALNRFSILRPQNTLLSPAGSESSKTTAAEHDKSSWRASFSPLQRTESSLGFGADNTDTCGPLVKVPFDGPFRAWEGQMEVVLKDIYTSIRDEKLPLFGADTGYQQSQPQGGLAVMGRLKRSPSVLSKAPSEGQASLRGRINEATRTQGGRWTSKSRSRPRLGNGFSSSRTSFDDGHSIWSPSPSSATWSRNSLGRTQTSMSIDSFASGYPNSDYQQSIGFANALSQAITRDDYTVGASSQSIMSEEFQTTQLLDDESLELLGPPWVKEGIVMHKHHLDGVDKKAKDRNWNEVFAVVQKGSMSLFSFSTKSMRQKARTGRKPAVGAVVGGGNWQENATSLGCFSLRQTLASALPPPGYSRTRPNVWALSLPSGAVHLFQVGTPEISKEFVLTVNYWSARLSTHPLIGGISNIEYGWSDAVINNALIGPPPEESPLPQRPGSAAAGRTSMHSRQGSRQSSIRSSFDVGGNIRTKLPGDRIHIAEWAPPSQSLRPSQCSESEQLEALLAYVKSVEDELQQHNQLRSPMLLAFTPRGHNAAKAMANWERKSSHLLREIVKFRTYVDSLQHATERRNEIYTERENARRAARGEDIDDLSSVHSDEADMTLKPE